MGTLKHNWLAILIATFVAQAIGFGVYGTFGEQWMEWHNLTEEFINANFSMTPFIVSIIGSIIMYTLMSLTFKHIGVHSAGDGLKWGAILGFAFAFLGPYTQGHFEYNVISGLMDATNNFLGVLVGGLILGAWRKYETA